MSLKDRMYALGTPEEVDAFIAQNPSAAIFKAGTCHKTMQGWGNVEQLLREREDVPVGIIRVVEQRPASNRVAERTGITHQSPQIIVFRNGQAVFDLDNWDITLDNLEPRLAASLPEVAAANTSAPNKSSNLGPYIAVMDAYLAGQISEPEFQMRYLGLFKNDASLRSQEEFGLIDSLFGNPDDHHVHAGAIMQLEAHRQDAGQVGPLAARVKVLRDQMSGQA